MFRTAAAIGPEATLGSTIPSTAAAHPTRIEEPPTSTGAQRAATPCRVARPTRGKIKVSAVAATIEAAAIEAAAIEAAAIEAATIEAATIEAAAIEAAAIEVATIEAAARAIWEEIARAVVVTA